jgi:eukaryotic-like serine/threonine-protein kinase
MLQEPSPEAPISFGPYQLIRRIGAGGMGEVFLAREGGDRPRAVVVKKVLPNLTANRAFVGRFLDESKVVVRLNHANIARTYAMGDVNGDYYLSMEYVQGKTVSRFTKRLRDRKQEMPVGIILLLGERICQGLEYAHHATDERGASLALVHRDLSPANVCISYRGEVKIIDFGAAQSTLKEEQTAPRVVIGNLTYMAPEQARKQLVDGRADVYSCGVLLWELLAWKALPQNGDPIERWRKAASPMWEAPSTFRPGLGSEIDEVILRSLRKEPNERFATARAFGEALAQARLKSYPHIADRDLGHLLENSFSKEKNAEDAVLYEAVYGKTTKLTIPEQTRRLIVPANAHAFEHGLEQPPDFSEREDVTEPDRQNPLAKRSGLTTAVASSGKNLRSEVLVSTGAPLPSDWHSEPQTAMELAQLHTPTPKRQRVSKSSFGIAIPQMMVEREIAAPLELVSEDSFDIEPMAEAPIENRGLWAIRSSGLPKGDSAMKIFAFTGIFLLAIVVGFGLTWLLLE